MESFNHNQALQKRLHPIGHLDRIIISDAEAPGALVCGDARTPDGELRIPRMRNIALAHAEKCGYDMLLLLDSDVVLLEDPVTPENAFTLTWSFYLSQSEAKSGVFNLEDKSRWRGGSWFVLKRQCFGLRFCEDYIGYNSQDVDFHHCVLVPAVGPGSHWSTRSIHVWHDLRLGSDIQRETNRVLLAKRLFQVMGRDALSEVARWNDWEFMGILKAIIISFPEIGRAKMDPQSILSPDRLQSLLALSRRVRSLPGAIAEVGIFKGGTLFALATENPDKTAWGFDTFSGIPAGQITDKDRHKAGNFASAFGAVRAAMSSRPNIHLVPGEFPASAEACWESEFSLVHCDVDTYLGTQAVIDWFWPRLSAGGVLLFDDYHYAGCPGVSEAVGEFSAREAVPINISPETIGSAIEQVFFIKP